MDEGRIMQEQLSRATQELVAEGGSFRAPNLDFLVSFFVSRVNCDPSIS